ncbi:reverse transcriptase domain-containing protein [Tanacetum coccineum]
MEELLQAPTERVGDAIVVPAVLANQFELKVGLLNLVNAILFQGFKNDDPHSHIRRFTKITQTIKLNQVPYDIIKLILFPFSLERADRTWLEKEPLNSITTWNDLVSKFVNQFFPPSRTTNLQNDITNFQQKYSETSSEAWERFKDLQRKCPHHGFSTLRQIDTFYNGQAAGDFIQGDVYAATGNYNAGGPLPSNTIPNPREDIKVITTRSGITLAGPSVPSPNPSPSSKELEQDPEMTMDQMFKKLHFNVSFAEALAYMLKYAKMLKDLLSNKEKLLKLANTPLNENCQVVLLKKLPEKLGDPSKFLIPCDFSELEECMALDDLGADINLMPLSVWKKLMLPELIPTRVTLELANRSVSYPAGIAEDVFVQVGKFTFPADFVVVYYDHGNESINLIDIIDTTCEDYFLEVLNVQKSIHPLSGSPTPSSDPIVASPSLSLTLFEDSEFFLEETEAFLALDSIPPYIDNGIYDSKGDILFLENLLKDELPERGTV